MFEASFESRITGNKVSICNKIRQVFVMSAFDEFVALVENTDVMKQMQKSLREGFIHFLGDIC